jgi:hypothetical protein
MKNIILMLFFLFISNVIYPATPTITPTYRVIYMIITPTPIIDNSVIMMKTAIYEVFTLKSKNIWNPTPTPTPKFMVSK